MKTVRIVTNPTTTYLQGDEANIIEESECDACGQMLAACYEADRYGNVEVFIRQSSNGDLIGLLCPQCALLK